jgi:hypothetical protein
MEPASKPDYTTWTSEQLVQRVLELERRLREQVNQLVYFMIDTVNFSLLMCIFLQSQLLTDIK